MPAGIYHIVSNYGDANSVVRSDIRVQASKLTGAWPHNRYGQLTLTVLATGFWVDFSKDVVLFSATNDVVKEANGAFPRVILAEGDYRAIARNENRTYERAFKVVTGVDGEVEVLAR